MITILIVYGVLKIVNINLDSNRKVLTNEKLLYENKLDSIINLPWNLKWNKTQPDIGQVYNKSNLPNPDLEYTMRNSNDSITIINLRHKLELNKESIRNISNFDTNAILLKLCGILLFIIYPLRGLILLLIWSIKIIKE